MLKVPSYHVACLLNVALLCFGFAATNASVAENVSISSVESLTCASEVVAVGHIVKISTSKGPGSVVYTDCVFDVSEDIKGAPSKEISFCCRDLSDDRAASLAPDKELLVMLSRWKDHYTDSQVASGAFADPYYEARMHNLLVPTSNQIPFSIIDLSKPLKNLYASDLSILKDRSELLRVCRAWAKSPITVSLDREVPFDSPIHGELWGGSAVYLVVPAEDKYREQYLALARSKKSYERQNAAAELWKFPGQETEKVLRDLLSDSTENVWLYSNDTISKIEFGVRAAAYRSLQKLGEPVPQIELERKPTAAEESQYRHEAWQKSFKEALPEGWTTTMIADGESMDNWDGRKTVVLVTCSNGSSQCRLILIPREWSKAKLPNAGYAGMWEGDSQGGRYFYVEGDIPKDLKARLTQYFGLVASKS